MPRTKNVPRRSEGFIAGENQRAAAALAAALGPAPAPHHHALQVGGAGASGVTVKEEVEEEEEETPEGHLQGMGALAPGFARVLASGPRAAFADTPAPAPHHADAPPWGTGASGVTSGVKMEEGAEETLAQQRDRLALALARGPVRVDSHIKVEDSTSGEDTDGDGEGEEEGTGADGGGVEEEGTGGEEGAAVPLAGTAHAPGDDGGRGVAPRRSSPADRAARAKRGRGDVAAADDVRDAPAPKRKHGGAQVGPSGRHGVYELTGRNIRKATPWLKWRARLNLPGTTHIELGPFSTVDDAARAYDAEVRRRGWVHARPLNFPEPEELAAYPQAGERCDERGLPLSHAPVPPAAAQGAAAAHGAAGQRPPKLSAQKPGKNGFFGVVKSDTKNKATRWRAEVYVTDAKKGYAVGHFATKKEAARAYDAEVRRRGWTLIKLLNFPDPADDGALPPSGAGVGRQGLGESRGAGLT